MNAVEQKFVDDTKAAWATLSTEGKKALAALAKEELGFMTAHPKTYTIIIFIAGLVVMGLAWMAIG